MSDARAPLTPLSLAILLALADESMHGYALMKAIEEQTDGALRPGTGTLYAALDRLLDEGWIIDDGHPADDRRRGRSYSLSEEGRSVAREEIRRLSRVVRLAGERDLAPREAR